MKIEIVRECDVSRSPRVRQLEAMFDCPVTDKARLIWSGDFPYQDAPWSVGLIVGPSGAGKSTILREVFGEPLVNEWREKSVLDDFSSALSMTAIAEICRAVGFNTIPAWMRPYSVLSNGERFRVDMARRLAEIDGTIVVDEFTSVVDRQVAQIGSHAVQKYVRKNKKQFVAATCHYDVIEWLQPDWILEPATMTFTRRALQRRPTLDVTICQVPYSAWKVFAPFHYMSAELNHSARCFGLFVGNEIASIVAMLHQPHAKVKNLKRFSRVVTHPDWQGLGLGPIITERVAAAYKALNVRTRTYPAHPSYVRTFGADPLWMMTKRSGTFGPASGVTKSITLGWKQGNRPCAVFEYVGPAMDLKSAERLIGR